MKILKFEDLIAWQKSQDLAVVIYSEFKKLNDFDLDHRFAELLFLYRIISQKDSIDVVKLISLDFY